MLHYPFVNTGASSARIALPDYRYIGFPMLGGNGGFDQPFTRWQIARALLNFGGTQDPNLPIPLQSMAADGLPHIVISPRASYF